MTRNLLLALVLAAAPFAAAAQAQKVFRCVDERGHTFYTEKPGRNCKPTHIGSLPNSAPAPVRPATPPARAAAPQPPATPVVVAGPMNHCDSLRAAATRLENSPSRANPKVNERRLAEINQALQRDCGS